MPHSTVSGILKIGLTRNCKTNQIKEIIEIYVMRDDLCTKSVFVTCRLFH